MEGLVVLILIICVGVLIVSFLNNVSKIANKKKE
jgi:hypothetical protein